MPSHTAPSIHAFRRAASRAAALACVLAGLAAAGAAPAADEPVSKWRIAFEIDGYGSRSVPLCLVRKSGLFGTSWLARLPDDAGPDCAELLQFDPQTQRIHLAFERVLALSEYNCSSDLKVQGRHPCTSAFFTRGDGPPQRRRLDRDKLREALDDSGVFKLAEAQLADQRRRDADEQARLAQDREQRRLDCRRRIDRSDSLAALDQVQSACRGALDDAALAALQDRRRALEAAGQQAALQEYRAAFAALSAQSPPADLEAFAARYLRADPDALVPKVQGWLRARTLAAYRAEFAALGPRSSIDLIDRFVERYAADDPDGLVPRARGLRDELERAQLAALAQAERERQRQEAVLGISDCKRQMRDAQDMRAREQKVSADSGVTQSDVLRRAAEIEFDCKVRIDRLYRVYRGLGGTRSLDEIS